MRDVGLRHRQFGHRNLRRQNGHETRFLLGPCQGSSATVRGGLELLVNYLFLEHLEHGTGHFELDAERIQRNCPDHELNCVVGLHLCVSEHKVLHIEARGVDESFNILKGCC